MKQGKFIVLEGGEGVGKSTQAKLLAQNLENQGIEVVLTREPGGVASAEQIRQLLVSGAVDRWLPISELLLHMAARNEHVEKLIKPALNSGKWVICDRFIFSTIVYQGYTQGVGEKKVRQIYELIFGDFYPDFTFIFDFDHKKGLRRAAARNIEQRYEAFGEDFHQQVFAGFLKLLESDFPNLHLIDANQSKKQILGLLLKHLENAI